MAYRGAENTGAAHEVRSVSLWTNGNRQSVRFTAEIMRGRKRRALNAIVNDETAALITADTMVND